MTSCKGRIRAEAHKRGHGPSVMQVPGSGGGGHGAVLSLVSSTAVPMTRGPAAELRREFSTGISTLNAGVSFGLKLKMLSQGD